MSCTHCNRNGHYSPTCPTRISAVLEERAVDTALINANDSTWNVSADADINANIVEIVELNNVITNGLERLCEDHGVPVPDATPTYELPDIPSGRPRAFFVRSCRLMVEQGERAYLSPSRQYRTDCSCNECSVLRYLRPDIIRYAAGGNICDWRQMEIDMGSNRTTNREEAQARYNYVNSVWGNNS